MWIKKKVTTHLKSDPVPFELWICNGISIELHTSTEMKLELSIENIDN